MSASADGKVLRWLFNEKGSLVLEEGFVLLASCLPAGVNLGSRSRGDGEMGGVRLSVLGWELELISKQKEKWNDLYIIVFVESTGG